MQPQLVHAGNAGVIQAMTATEGLTEHLSRSLSDPDRLAAVHHLDLLDTQPEEVFDSLTRLASRLIGTPASALSIVDDQRDFYKSQCGFPESLAAGRQLTGPTFCRHVVAGAGSLIIDDTHAHPAWRAMPVVEGLEVRAYLGVPVMVDGHPIGSFSVLDSRPRRWQSSEVETLVQFSLAASREMELRAALKSSRAEADRANALAKANEELLAVVIHDLRTPVQIIRMCTTLLSRTVSTHERAHLDRLTRAAEVIRSLVDTLVPGCVARTSSIPVRQTVISSTALLTDAVDAMGMVAGRASIGLSVAPDSVGAIVVDYPQMLRVLGNLISNCIKYCPPGSSVLLSSRVAGDSVFVSVSDDGPGMSSHDLEHAFERGWQGQNGIALQDGSGLGLAIVRGLVEQNRGSVALASYPGGGTKVTVKLPAALISKS